MIQLSETLRVENITHAQNGKKTGYVYELKTDEHGRESWILVATVLKMRSESWLRALKRALNE